MFGEVTAAVAAGLVGLAVGWWASLAIRRVPREEPILRQWPRCHACDAYVAARDLIPVYSWFALRGRSRCCGAPLGYGYLALELGSGVLFAALTMRLGVSVELAAYLYLAAVCVPLFVIDGRDHRLPDALTLPSYVLLPALLTVAAVSTGQWWELLRAVLGGVVLFAAYYALAVVAAGALGFGDVKLAGLLGLALGWAGWYAVIVGALLGFVYGGVFSLALLAARKASSSTKIAFGPFMMLGALSALLIGDHVGAVIPLMAAR
jgi:leader peptidase (prepilin peptidase)/N-methyltransferase